MDLVIIFTLLLALQCGTASRQMRDTFRIGGQWQVIEGIDDEEIRDNVAPIKPTLAVADTVLHYAKAAAANALPRVTHRTLLYDDDYPSGMRRWIRRWNRVHDTYDRDLWSRSDVVQQWQELVVAKGDGVFGRQVLEAFEGYDHDIQRADLGRYMVLYMVGGIYADFDLMVLKSIEGVLSDNAHGSFIVFEETTLSAREAALVGQRERIRGGEPEAQLRIANYIMASSPHHPILRAILEECVARRHRPVTSRYDILFTTGPDVVSSVVDRLQKDNSFSDLGGVIISKSIADQHFRHLVQWHWVSQLSLRAPQPPPLDNAIE